MFGVDKKEFNALKELVDTQTTALESQQKVIEQLDDKLKRVSAKVSILEGLRERKESDEPWVELIGGDIDPEKGLQMNLDWNDAFIDQLRTQGYKGTTETALVAQWLLNTANSVKPQDD